MNKCAKALMTGECMQYVKIVLQHIKDAHTILDLGCGRGFIPYLARFCDYRNEREITGVDIYLPSLNFIRYHRLCHHLIRLDLKQSLPFRDKSYDAVFAFEVIEHLPKSNGIKLLDEIERIAEKRAIISTPTIFFTSMGTFRREGNPFQLHVSKWAVEDFRKRGYKVKGCGDLKMFGTRVGHNIGFLLSSLTYPFPDLSTQILAIKEF